MALVIELHACVNIAHRNISTLKAFVLTARRAYLYRQLCRMSNVPIASSLPFREVALAVTASNHIAVSYPLIPTPVISSCLVCYQGWQKYHEKQDVIPIG